MGHVMIILTGPNVFLAKNKTGHWSLGRKTAGYTGFHQRVSSTGEETSKHHKLTRSKYIIKTNWDAATMKNKIRSI